MPCDMCDFVLVCCGQPSDSGECCGQPDREPECSGQCEQLLETNVTKESEE
jgi:hypothetical protein